MIKTQNSKFKIQKCLFLAGLTLLLLFSLSSSVRGQSPTPSDVRQDIKERVIERINQIQEEFKKRAFWGTLKEISGTTLILDTQRGEKRIKTGENTKFIASNKKEIKFTDLEIGNFLIAMGNWKENGTLEGKRILVLKTTPKPVIKRHAIFGKVTDSSTEEQILQVSHIKNDGLAFEVKVTNKTVITKKVDGKIKKINFEAIKIGDRLVVVGTKEDGNETINAKLIHIIPGKAEGQESSATPTPRTKVTPTPSKTTKATPTPSQ